jgi:hypothetical protein
MELPKSKGDGIAELERNFKEERVDLMEANYGTGMSKSSQAD